MASLYAASAMMTVSSVSVVSFGERCAPSTPAPRSAHRRAHRRARAVRPDASRAFAPGRMLAASGSFFITTLVTHPLDVVKTNLQLERSAKGKVPATGVKQAHKSRAPSPRQTQHSSCAAAARHQSALLRRWSAVRALPQYRMLTSALPPPRSPSVPLTSALPTPPTHPPVEPPPPHTHRWSPSCCRGMASALSTRGSAPLSSWRREGWCRCVRPISYEKWPTLSNW